MIVVTLSLLACTEDVKTPDAPMCESPAVWYPDADGDGWGSDGADLAPLEACFAPAGYAARQGDCDDADARVHPGQLEPDCGAQMDFNCDGSTGLADADGDGVDACGDCDDADATVFPGQAETCNGIDDDCSGDVDDAATDAATWHLDADGDGYGGARFEVTSCEAPAGYVADATDCDDLEAFVNPAAAEACDGVDNDCNGVLDDAAGDAAAVWYPDADGDGHGQPDGAVAACGAPLGYARVGDDCDDLAAGTYPGAPETCDGADQDCDGLVDDGATDALRWYTDGDGDGVGDAEVEACEAPAGAVAVGGDCDDADAAVLPGAEETCNGLDDDCDGSVDEDGVDPLVWYADADGDGAGDPGSGILSCEAPAGFVPDGADCDDGDADTYPGAGETCDGVDQDCDGSVDEGAPDAGVWYADADADGYGAGAGALACAAPAGSVARGDDCDDGDADAYPGAVETCDGVDQDCDGSVDEDATDARVWYADADADGYGAGAGALACAAPAGSVARGDDCDDGDADAHPGAGETCDGVDQDCDGSVDEDATDRATWYADLDGDGVAGARWTTSACTAPAGYLSAAGDCDDLESNTYPGAPETCDGVDEDCDGSVDEDAVDEALWYIDADSDGAGDPSTSAPACEAPAGFVADATDCDDGDDTVAPEGVEVCDGLDNDCDGSIDESALDRTRWYADADGDGTGDAATVTRACDAPAGYVSAPGDCDDTLATRRPGGVELCDGLDNDCDLSTDEDALDRATWYADSDGDGAGDTDASVRACDAPAGHVASAGDCDDGDSLVAPDLDERCDGVDNDCDGDTDEDEAVDGVVYYLDVDGDGYGTARFSLAACDVPDGYVTNADDCDDTDAFSYPGGAERCDDADNDCDGSVDEGLYVLQYVDDDGDGYGDPDLTEYACLGTYGVVDNPDDCDDGNDAIRPSATETCDGVDEDCDGTIDNGLLVRRWVDADADGFGDPDAPVDVCPDTGGVAASDDDCDDADVGVNPDAVETCDGVDEDCNGTVDDGLLGSGAACATTSCKTLLAAQPSTTSGTYWVQPTGATSAVQAYCDMTTDGGGYTMYGVSGGASTCRYTDGNSCPTGMNLAVPRTQAHFASMVGRYGGSYFSIMPGIYNPLGGRSYTYCAMRSGGCPDWRALDGGSWYIRSSTFSEPNGDYTAGCWLGGYPVTTATVLSGAQGFNDADCSYCATSYVCSTNDK